MKLDPRLEERLAERELNLDADALNEARWAACNTRWVEGHVPTMERASEVADRAVVAYLLSAGLSVSLTEEEIQAVLDATNWVQGSVHSDMPIWRDTRSAQGKLRAALTSSGEEER